MAGKQVVGESVGGVAFRVTGRVQGVFYRVYGRNAAHELGIRGWIRNESDGSVTGGAFADPRVLERFLDRLREGPPAGRVDELTWEPIPEASTPAGFEIRY